MLVSRVGRARPWLAAMAATLLVSPHAVAQSSPARARALAAPAAPAAATPDACVPAASPLLACPATPMRLGHSATRTPPIQEPQRVRPRPTPTPGGDIDPRVIRGITARRVAVEILEREVQLTATLVRDQPRSDPRRADTLMRLAEDLQELAGAYTDRARALDQPIFVARTGGQAQRVAALEREQQQHLARARDRRAQLVRAFEVLVSDHPRYARMDEVLFYLAFAYQDARDMPNARRVYLTLIQRFPQSRFIPNAYLSFGEYFFERTEYAEARAFYDRVIAIDTRENTVRGFAMYKQAWTLFNLREYDAALAQFYTVIDYARARPDDPTVGPLARSARTELVTAYGAVYGVSRPLRTAEALATFRRYAADEGGAYEMLEHLGELYQDNGQWPNSIAVYHELMAARPASDRFCLWQAQVARATVASRPADDRMREVTRLLDVYDSFRGAPAAGATTTSGRATAAASTASTRPAAARAACRDATARVVYDLASHWHLEALGRGSDGTAQSTGTRDRATMARVARLYDALLERFPDLDQVQFPEYDRRDWPTRYRVAYYRADILRDQADHCACGPAYDRVAEMGGEFTEDAAYKAVLCYNDCFGEQLGRRAATAPPAVANRAEPAADAQHAADQPRALGAQEQAMSRAFARYVCFARSAPPPAPSAAAARNTAAAPAASEPTPEELRTTLLTIRYRRAYVHYNAHRYDEAAPLFREVVLADPGAPDPENLREIAADLLIDSLVGMAQRWNPPRASCVAALTTEIPRFEASLCTGAAAVPHSEFCTRAVAARCNAYRLQAEALIAAGQHAAAGNALVGILQSHPECTRTEGFHVDEVMYNAAVEFDRANLLGRAMRVRERLVEVFLPRGSVWAQRALYRLAGNYQAIQVFSRAADHYEQYAEYITSHRGSAAAAPVEDAARRAPGARPARGAEEEADPIEQAATALRRATLFRVALGEEARALDDAARFARYFGGERARQRDAAAVVFGIGQLYQDRAARLGRQAGGTPEERAARQAQARASWQQVVAHYASWIQRFARNGTPDQQIEGNVAVGRGYWNLGDTANAQRYFTAAVAAWGEPATPSAAPENGAPAAAPRAAPSSSADGAAPGNAGAPTSGERAIRAALAGAAASGGAGASADEAVERARTAAAEARFYLAEIVYQRFARAHLPVPPRGATVAAFRQWETRTLQPYIRQQLARLRDEATPQYRAVIATRVPNWEIAAYARLADMFDNFARALRDAPVPPDIEHNDVLMQTYIEARQRAVAQFQQPAEEGFQRCVARATAVHWFNDWSRLCERGLNALNARQYPLADEVRVGAELVFSRPANSRPAYELAENDE